MSKKFNVLSFLGLLRNKYLEQKQGNDHTFWSVILAGVYDVKNLKLKLHPGQESKYNSPWNIAADFTVNMSFMPNDIATMLLDEVIARRTDLVTKASAWTKNGLTEAVKELLTESNTLFDDMVKKLDEYPELKRMLYMILFRGEKIPYNADAYAVNAGIMFGFLKNDQKVVAVSNRIFETRMYDMFMAEEILESRIYKSAALDRNQFIRDGELDMERVLERFTEAFHDIYADADQTFIEENGHRFFAVSEADY